MSFVTAIRDYVEALNIVSESLNQNLTLTSFLSEIFVYVLKTFQTGLLYVVSFQWIRDFTLLPIVLPQFFAAILKETFVLESPSKVFFDFLEIPDFHQNKFLLGFFNSFFLSLPLSVVHIVTVRRLYIQGIPSAMWSIGGYLVGQLLFLTCTIFGIRFILIPWLTLEPLNYLLGVILIFRIIYSMVREPLVKIPGWSFGSSPKYKGFFITSFLLAWCEQSSIFQYLGNLTLSSNVTILESFSATSPVSSFVTHVLYVLGISLGSVFFTCFWGFVFLQVKNAVVLYTPLFLSSFIQKINTAAFVVALALSFTSIPFYGFDYLFTGPLGFVPQDSVFQNTVLDQTRVKEQKSSILSSPESNLQYVDIDVAPFDRGEYLTNTKVTQPLSFEDLNYRGEFDWIARQEKKSTITNTRGELFKLSKVFKQSRASQSKVMEPRKDDFNRLFSETDRATAEGFDLQDIHADRSITERFVNDSILLFSDQNEVKAYNELHDSSFPVDFLPHDVHVEKKLEQKIKQKYYSNPVYKSLLAFDVDFFLKRQPQTFQLNSQQEGDLYTKRRMLECYYDSLRHYANLPYAESFDTFFDGTKSFSSKVYNQQFKGTLQPLRRLFSLTHNNETEIGKLPQKILKFDQPGYEFSDKESFSAYHEELGPQAKESENAFPKIPSFLSQPLYAGWDERTRKFVITNKLLQRNWAGYKMNVEPEIRRQFAPEHGKEGRKIKFTAWPLSEKSVKGSKNDSPIPYVTLFETASDSIKNLLQININDSKLSYSYLPANVERFVQTANPQEEGKEESVVGDELASLAPKRGGFVWPGNSKFNFSAFSK